mgnify:CR=1 FL=1
MKKQLEQVIEFHQTYGVSYEKNPTLSDLKKSLLRYKLHREENEEYLDACEQEDLVEIADALGDMLYILCGTIISHGFQDKIEAIFDEIQRSNMSKLGADGKPIYREDGKVLKGPNYFKPDIEKILKKS